MSTATRQLALWLLHGEWRANPLRNLVALLAIALGVALGFAIHLINASALDEFSAAVRSLSGQADLQLRGALAQFDEAVYARVAADPQVEAASPVLELDLPPAGGTRPLKVLGVDVFQAAAVVPELIGVPAEGRALDALADDAIFLSQAAIEWLGTAPGERIALMSGTQPVSLRVAGTLSAARPGQRLAVMDIGAMQWRFGELGKLSRIDLRLKPGVERTAFAARLAATLGPGWHFTREEDQASRAATLSRAYRVNLNMLALVALFTGAFLVFSSQALAVLRRRAQLALLRVLGLTRAQVLRQLLLESACLGLAGSVLGLAAGYGVAVLALRLFGADLGGGYFQGVQPQAVFSLPAAAVFLLLGTGAALLGCAVPAAQAAAAHPAPVLKGGAGDPALGRRGNPWPGLAVIALGLACTRLPPLSGLPVFGYLAIALLLIGAILLMPRIAAWCFSALAPRAARRAAPALALAHLANAPSQASVALGGVLTSFSLMVAMAIMVASFRISVDDWLSRVLAADLYVRAQGGADATLSLDEQQAIAASPVVARADFQRNASLDLDPTRPAVALLGRAIDADDPAATMPLREQAAGHVPAGAIPIWISEAMVDLYGYRSGQSIALPLGPPGQRFFVAGVWRDYVRQTGAIQIRLADYRRLSGDLRANDGALRLAPGITPAAAVEALRALPFGATLAFSTPGAIHADSLRIFDRSFAVTYLLEAVAVLIGLFGVAATFSAQTLARAAEFGMLRHVGLTRGQILAMLAIEGALLAVLGVLLGLGAGIAISLILVFIVNPQSFHWTMEWHPPWGMMSAAALALLLGATLAALLAGRRAGAINPLQAVRETG